MDRSYKITTNGTAVITACLDANKPLTLTRAAVGSGSVPEDTDLRDVHALYQFVADAAVGERTRTGNLFHTAVQYSNRSHPQQEAFSLKEFILYATNPDTGEETDFAYGTLGDYAQPVPAYQADLPESVFTFPLIFVISPELAISITAVPGIVTYADLEAMLSAGYIGTVKADIKVPPDAWQKDDSPQITGCPFHADVPFEGLTGDEVPTVAFHHPTAARMVAPIAQTSTGILRLYAAAAPTEQLTATATLSTGPQRVSSDVTRLPWELKPATKANLGGVIPGDDFIIDGKGLLSLNTQRVLTPDNITPEQDVKQDISQILDTDS